MSADGSMPQAVLDVAVQDAGETLVGWMLGQLRLLEIARRPWFLKDGQVVGELLYHDPPPERA